MSVVATAAPLLVYFSSISGNTARFIEKLGLPARAHSSLPSRRAARQVDEPYVLVTPTYGGGQTATEAPSRSRSSGS